MTPTTNTPKVLFVYNANSGLGNGLIDTFKKYVTPSKYPCKLCSLTYGVRKKKRQWEVYTQSIDKEVVFLHKNEFDKQYPGHPFALPAMFLDDGQKLEEKISAEDFAQINTLDDLIDLTHQKLS